MKKFVLRRFAQMIFVWILVSIFSFSIVYFAPGDPLYIYMTPGATGHKMTDEELENIDMETNLDNSEYSDGDIMEPLDDGGAVYELGRKGRQGKPGDLH